MSFHVARPPLVHKKGFENAVGTRKPQIIPKNMGKLRALPTRRPTERLNNNDHWRMSHTSDYATTTMAYMSTYASPLLSAHGAQPAPADHLAPHTAGVPWHYGNPFGEQRAPLALVDRSNRVILSVTGDDREAFLTNLLSKIIAPGATMALDLDANGRIQHEMDVAVTEDEVFLIVSPHEAETLRDHLVAMIFWSKVEITVSPLQLVTVFGEHTPLDAAFARTIPGTPLRTDYGVRDVEAAADAILQQNGQLAGLMSFEAYRVARGEPDHPVDCDEKTIPHEVGLWLAEAVDLDKGCYCGQETVARVENLGRAPRALVVTLLDGSVPQLPTPQTPVTLAGRTVGTLGSVVHHHELGPIALATIKASALQRSGEFMAGDCAMSVDKHSLPRPSSGAGRDAINQLRGDKPRA